MSPNPKVAFQFCSLAKPEYCVHHSTNDRSYITPISSISINEPIKSVLHLPLDRKSFTNLSICLPIYFCPKFIVNLITHLFIYLLIYLINYSFVYSSFTFSVSQFQKNLTYQLSIQRPDLWDIDQQLRNFSFVFIRVKCFTPFFKHP